MAADPIPFHRQNEAISKPVIGKELRGENINTQFELGVPKAWEACGGETQTDLRADLYQQFMKGHLVFWTTGREPMQAGDAL